MKAKQITPKQTLESKIQSDIIKMLTLKGWHVKNLHGNKYSHGFPDLWAMHPDYRYRWIEVKRPKKHRFTQCQQEDFPLFARCHIGIWVLTAATEHEYRKLFEPCNWTEYMYK